MRATEIEPSWQAVIEDGTIKPQGSLDANQSRKRSKRLARTQQQMGDENQRRAAKERDLQSRTP
jgi:hypothetical protein